MQDYFIEGIYFKNLLSFDGFEIRDFKRVNVFIGENSSGKSNIIRAIIGFTPGGTGSRAERYIYFYNNDSITQSLSKSDYQDCYFEIPPFRNLVIPEGIPISRQNWRSGILDLKKIREVGDKFYSPLREIIDIEDFSLCGSALKESPISFDKSGYLTGERWTNCGYYSRRVDGQLKELPVDLLGWGTKSIIIIYYNLYFNPKSIAFIEEPEISAHPKLLKALFDWAFPNRRECQFFITTHSSLLIDRVFLGEIEGGIKIMNVYKENDRTRVRCLKHQIDAIRTLEHLGYKSSNLLFTNYVIWVEGISDIYYYEAMIKLISAMEGGEFIRGLHYELMAFGGSVEYYLFKVKSSEDLPLILSFARKGAVFCDYDNDSKKTKARLEKLKKAQGNQDFKMGCTGAMLKPNGKFDTKTTAIPCTIENVMSSAAAEIVLRQFHGKKKTKDLIAKLCKNNKITGIDKIAVGATFLKHVNEELSKKRAKGKITAIFVRKFISDKKISLALIRFFKNIIEEIRKVNA